MLADELRLALAVGSGPDTPMEANARLIAAAPDLLAACERTLARLSDPETVAAWTDEDRETVRLAEVAVAKAKGGAA